MASACATYEAAFALSAPAGTGGRADPFIHGTPPCTAGKPVDPWAFSEEKNWSQSHPLKFMNV